MCSEFSLLSKRKVLQSQNASYGRLEHRNIIFQKYLNNGKRISNGSTKTSRNDGQHTV